MKLSIQKIILSNMEKILKVLSISNSVMFAVTITMIIGKLNGLIDLSWWWVFSYYICGGILGILILAALGYQYLKVLSKKVNKNGDVDSETLYKVLEYIKREKIDIK